MIVEPSGKATNLLRRDKITSPFFASSNFMEMAKMKIVMMLKIFIVSLATFTAQ